LLVLSDSFIVESGIHYSVVQTHSMPFKRKSFKRRSFRRRRGAGGFSLRSGVALARQAYRGVKYLKGLVNSELYKYDQSAAGTINASTGWVQGITSMSQGDGIAARTGNSILCKSVNVMGYVQRNVTSPAQSNTVRVSLICDRQQVGDSAPTLGDIWTTTGPYTHLNPNTVGRFSILHQKLYTLNADKPEARINFQKWLRMHTRFNGTSGTDIQKCGLYLWIVAESETNMPTFAYEARLSYHDN